MTSSHRTKLGGLAASAVLATVGGAASGLVFDSSSPSSAASAASDVADVAVDESPGWADGAFDPMQHADDVPGDSAAGATLLDLAAEVGVDDPAATEALVAAGAAGIDSLETAGSIDATQADALRELLPGAVDEILALSTGELEEGSVPPSVNEALHVFGLDASDLSSVDDETSVADLLATAGLTPEAVHGAVEAGAEAGIDSLESNGAVDAETAEQMRMLLPVLGAFLDAGIGG
jgi:hypothetical protein